MFVSIIQSCQKRLGPGAVGHYPQTQVALPPRPTGFRRIGQIHVVGISAMIASGGKDITRMMDQIGVYARGPWAHHVSLK